MSIIIGANSAVAGGYAVDNSCRFNDASDDSLTRSLGASETSLKKGTLSFWIKLAEAVGTAMWIYSNEVADDNNRAYIEIDANANLRVLNSQGGSNPLYFITDAEYRDFSAWSHFVIAIDTTQGTEANRVKIYDNGVQITSFSQETYPSVNTDLKLFEGGQTNKNHIGNIHGQSAKLSAYLSEFVYLDGTQNAATDFGEFDEDSGIWKPIDVSGLTFGNNGVYLNFQTSAELGDDVSGNTNDFTENNLTAIDQTTDTPTNNFATLNPLIYESRDNTFAEGNLKITGGGSDSWTNHYGVSTIAVSSGKWFVEAKITTAVGSQGMLGIIGTSTALAGSLKDNGPANIDAGGKITGGGSDIQTGLTSFANGDIAGAAFDATNGTIQFYRNGSAYGSAVSSIASDTYYFVTNSYNAGAVVEFNFGSPPYSESGGNSDGDGYGNFSMAVPSGYYALCTKNLAEYG